MAKDLRSWLKELEESVPGELIRVSKELNPSAFEQQPFSIRWSAREGLRPSSSSR